METQDEERKARLQKAVGDFVAKLKEQGVEIDAEILEAKGDTPEERAQALGLRMYRYPWWLIAYRWFIGDWWRAGVILDRNKSRPAFRDIIDPRPDVRHCVFNASRKMVLSNGLTSHDHALFVANKMNTTRIDRQGE